MKRHYSDPFDTQVTPEEFEKFYDDVDEKTLREGSMPDTNKCRPLPTAIEDIIEEDMDESFDK